MRDKRGIAAAAARALAGGRDASLPAQLVRFAAGVAAISVVAAMAGRGTAQPPAPRPAGPVWLDQNWTPDQRDRYHHESQGTLTLPIPAGWFLALERPYKDGPGMFADQTYLDRFGFIPSPAGPRNPDNLPIGFARTRASDPRNLTKQLDGFGFTCAACHTGRIEYKGTSILVDGGPALTDLGTFGQKLGLALGETLLPAKFERFADRLLGKGHWIERAALRLKVTDTVAKGLGELLQGQKGVTEGSGRLDALNRIGNKVFGEGMGIPANNAGTTAPVAYPHIWDTAWFDWVQYNGSIRQPMVRNAGEAMGVGAVVNYKAGPTPRFTSTIPIGALHNAIEEVLGGAAAPLPGRKFTGLRPPAWPEDVLGAIDRPLAARGATLYVQHCQSCHGPAPVTEEFWTSDRWRSAPDTSGQIYLTVPNIPISVVGTDPAQAADMMARRVRVPADVGLINAVGTAGNDKLYSFPDALKQVVEKVANRWYDSQTPPVTPDERKRLNGFRDNLIRAEMAYKARPLDGVWATPPYLHNGSVLTLWELLSPMAERRTRFSLGGRQFDPRWVGYVSGGSFPLDTSLAGNRNTGHVFDGPADGPRPTGLIGPFLNLDDRWALVEYLKTL
jgi:hypothetical protein